MGLTKKFWMNWYFVAAFCFLTCTVFYSETGYAQKRKKRNKNDYQVIDFEDLTKVGLFEFPNVNKVPNFYNKSELGTIIKLDRQKDWEKLYPKLLN
jgi:hypothetical protein